MYRFVHTERRALMLKRHRNVCAHFGLWAAESENRRYNFSSSLARSWNASYFIWLFFTIETLPIIVLRMQATHTDARSLSVSLAESVGFARWSDERPEELRFVWIRRGSDSEKREIKKRRRRRQAESRFVAFWLTAREHSVLHLFSYSALIFCFSHSVSRLVSRFCFHRRRSVR